eukprot:m.45627 g.45627  ORF g.45627 m.45627 type:complete len:478 (-) comp10275_c0_seq2:720-2153(-)
MMQHQETLLSPDAPVFIPGDQAPPKAKKKKKKKKTHPVTDSQATETAKPTFADKTEEKDAASDSPPSTKVIEEIQEPKLSSSIEEFPALGGTAKDYPPLGKKRPVRSPNPLWVEGQTAKELKTTNSKPKAKAKKSDDPRVSSAKAPSWSAVASNVDAAHNPADYSPAQPKGKRKAKQNGLADIIDAMLTPKKASKKKGSIKLSLNALTVDIPSSQKQKTKSQPKGQSQNPTEPLQRRGKERETPKVKKPSQLKKVILKERESRKAASDNCQVLEKEESVQVEADEMDQLSSSGPAEEMATDDQQELRERFAKKSIHSRRFREYCSQTLNKTLDADVKKFLDKLRGFQERSNQRDPMRAKINRRYVMGLREVTKHLKLNKIKCVLMAPDVEKIKSDGGLDDAIKLILDTCAEKDIVVIFALSRRQIGRALKRPVAVSVVGILNYQGAQDIFKDILVVAEQGREDFEGLHGNDCSSSTA